MFLFIFGTNISRQLIFFYRCFVYFACVSPEFSTRPLEQKLPPFPSIRCCSVHGDGRTLWKATAFPLLRATAALKIFKSTSSPAISKRL